MPTTRADINPTANSVWQRVQQVLGADLRSLVLLRIGLGLLILADIADRLRDLRAHYTDFGLLPRGPLLSKFMNEMGVCVHTCTGTAVGAVLLFGLQASVAMLLIVGWRTRRITILSWFLLYSLHLRNPVVLQGGDDLLRMMLFWAMFLPLGARYSVDAALGYGAALGPAPAAPRHVFSTGTVALVGQVVLMYWSTAVLKTGTEWHQEASAVYYALHFDQLALRIGLWLGQFYALTTVLTQLTMAWEAFGPFLLLSPFYFGPLRTFAAVAFTGMHHCFALCLMLGLFPWIDTVSMLMLLPAWFWDQLKRRDRTAEQQKVTLYFDAPCEVCKKLVFIVREFLLVRQVNVQEAQSRPDILKIMHKQNSWVIQTPEGQFTQFDGMLALMRVSPLVPGFVCRYLAHGALHTFGNWVYRGVATARSALSLRTAYGLPWRPIHAQPGALNQILAGLLFALIVAWNGAAWPGSWIRFPDALRPIAYMLRIDQNWGMFAPFPQKEDGWYAFPGHLQDGKEVDVFRRVVGPVSLDKPEVVSDLYPNQRWSKYMMNIWMASYSDYRLYFGQYLCRAYNGISSIRMPGSLTDFEIVYMKEMTLPDYQYSKPEKVVLWKHYCYEVPKT